MTQSIETGLEQWHTVVKNQDMALLNDILADEVEFHSPTVWKPKQGKQITAYILKTVMGIFQDFTYHRQFISGNSVVLEFSAMVAGKNIKGIDMIRWNDQGKIEHFEVMIRPINGLQLMLDKMTKNLQDAGFVPK